MTDNTAQNTLRIGFIGLGHMGSLMAQRLLKAGYSVTVYDRTREKAEEVAQQGAQIAESPRALAAKNDIILSCVSDNTALEAVMHGPDGAITAARGKTFIDLSTVSPAELSVSMPATAAAEQMYAAALAQGHDEDYSVMLQFMEELSGLPTRKDAQ